MSSDSGLEDLPLIDLFRAEVETHVEVLNTSLLALEKSPGDTSGVSEMMRAAHSIKGAARVVGVDPAVNVAHVMEDCFVDAQKGILTLSPGDVDVLLRGVDLLGKISEATRDPNLDLGSAFDEVVKSLVLELEAMRARGAGPGEAAVVEASVSRPLVRPKPVQSQPAPAAAELAVPTLPPVVTIAFPEILDAGAAEEARGQLLEAMDRGSQMIEIDLRATKDLDVQGLAFLAAVPQHLALHGGRQIRLAGMSAQMDTVFKVTGLSQPYAASPGEKPEGQ